MPQRNLQRDMPEERQIVDSTVDRVTDAPQSRIYRQPPSELSANRRQPTSPTRPMSDAANTANRVMMDAGRGAYGQPQQVPPQMPSRNAGNVSAVNNILASPPPAGRQPLNPENYWPATRPAVSAINAAAPHVGRARDAFDRGGGSLPQTAGALISASGHMGDAVIHGGGALLGGVASRVGEELGMGRDAVVDAYTRGKQPSQPQSVMSDPQPRALHDQLDRLNDRPYSEPAPQSQPAGSVPWYLGGAGSALGRPVSAPGATPSTPTPTSPANEGAGSGTNPGMRRVEIPGATGYAMVPDGSTIGQYGPSRDDLARANLFSAIDQRTAQSMQGTQNAMQRAAAGQSGGGPMQLDPRISAMTGQLQGISEMIQSGRGPNGRPLTADGMSALINRANALDRGINELFGVDADVFKSGQGNMTDLQRQMLANDGALAQTDLQGQYRLADTQASGTGSFNSARAAAIVDEMGRQALPPSTLPTPDSPEYAMAAAGSRAANAAVQRYGNVSGAVEGMLREIREAGIENPYADVPDEIARSNPGIMFTIKGLHDLNERLSRVPMPRENFADGGLVPGMDGGFEAFAEGGLVGAMNTAPQAQAGPPIDVAAMQNYQQYVAMAQQMGLDPVDFEQFSQMATPPMQGGVGMPEMQPHAAAAPNVLGMAEGGMVPGVGALDELVGGQMDGGSQVDGKMVFDPDPMAPTDSIPAMIDGQRPAALDSGEFVMPKDVVMYYGTEKLTKLIEKARGSQGQADPQAQQGALANV